MKIGYFADGPWSHIAFQKIILRKNISIQFICVRFDHQDSVLKSYGEKYGIPVLFHKNINSKEFLESISKFNCDLYVSMSFNQIFKQDILVHCPLGIINCHAGKLPFYRGRNILNWALINDEKEFGITVHFVDTGIDTGDIILQRAYPISEEDNYETLLNRSYTECGTILDGALGLMLEGKDKRIPQKSIDEIGFYCGRRVEGDELINWNTTSREIFNFIRAVCAPGPKATCRLESNIIKINKCIFLEGAKNYKGIPGQVIGLTESGYLVKTADSFVEILEIESEKKLRIGDRLQ